MADRGIEVNGIGFPTFLRMYIRSFFSQGSFGFRNRQNIGFAWSLEPAGLKIWTDPEDRKRFYSRHLEYYNGNPFMVSLVLGAVARMEERLRDGDGVIPEDIDRFKLAVGQAVGSLGDRFFWRTLRPFGLVCGLAGTLFFGMWGVPLALLAFNIPVFLLRWRWLVKGYRLGPRVVIEIKNPVLDSATDLMESFGGAVLAFFVLASLGKPDYGLGAVTVGTAALFGIAFVMRRWLPPSIVMASSALLAAMFGLLMR